MSVRIMDPEICYRSHADGSSLLSIFRMVGSRAGLPMLLVGLTDDDEVIGCFTPMSVTNNPVKDVKDAHDSMVFMLSPKESNWPWTGKCSSAMLMESTPHGIAIGVDGPAIEICRDVKHGVSKPSACFNSPALTSHTDFLLKNIEIWILK
eukprot:Selendium_serpulae@DN4156_c0_g1_i6.p2